MKIWPLFLVAGGVISLFAFDILHVEDFVRVGCRGKQAEAKQMLRETRKHLHTFSERNNGRIPNNFGDLAWEPKTDRYTYLIAPGYDGKFIVEANAKTREMNGDVWQIDELGELTNKVNGCAAAEP